MREYKIKNNFNSGKKINKYSLDGKLLASYNTVTQAFRENNIPEGKFREMLRGIIPCPDDIIFKYNNSKDQIPVASAQIKRPLTKEQSEKFLDALHSSRINPEAIKKSKEKREDD